MVVPEAVSFSTGELVGLPARDQFCLGGSHANTDNPSELCAELDLHAAEQARPVRFLTPHHIRAIPCYIRSGMKIDVA